jgi:hypothetical protein
MTMPESVCIARARQPELFEDTQKWTPNLKYANNLNLAHNAARRHMRDLSADKIKWSGTILQPS